MPVPATIHAGNGAGSFQALRSLSYTGTPGAFDGRSQAEQDLEAVQAAIRAIVSSRQNRPTDQALRSLSYTGTPGAFDGRSQAEQDLEAVQAAIRAIVSSRQNRPTDRRDGV